MIVITRQEAAELIKDNDFILFGGSGGGHAVAEEIIAAIGERYQATGTPRDLTIMSVVGVGDWGDGGLSHLAHEGLLKRVVGGFWGNSLKMVELAKQDLVEAYNFPQGVLSHLLRASASRSPGVITKTGLHTFVDPRLEGGQMNPSAREELVKLIEFEGEEYLFYPSPEFTVGLIRGSSIDKEGNLSMENEVGTFSMLSIGEPKMALKLI